MVQSTKKPAVGAGADTIGVGIIARNAGKTIKQCVKSFAPFVDQIVVVLAGESTDNTAK